MVIYRLQPLDKLSKINLEAHNSYEYDEPNRFISKTLPDIDILTMQFADAEELKKYFKLGNSDCYIWYNYKGENKLELLYASDVPMRNYTLEDSIYVSSETEYFKKDLEALLNSASKTKYINFLHDNGYMNDYLYKKLNAYKDLYEPRNNDSINLKQTLTDDIKKHITNYTVLRNLYFGTKEYKNAFSINKNIDVKPVETEKKYMDDSARMVYDTFMRGDMEELYEFDDIIPENVRKKIEEQEQFQKIR